MQAVNSYCSLLKPASKQKLNTTSVASSHYMGFYNVLWNMNGWLNYKLLLKTFYFEVFPSFWNMILYCLCGNKCHAEVVDGGIKTRVGRPVAAC